MLPQRKRRPASDGPVILSVYQLWELALWDLKIDGFGGFELRGQMEFVRHFYGEVLRFNASRSPLEL